MVNLPRNANRPTFDLVLTEVTSHGFITRIIEPVMHRGNQISRARPGETQSCFMTGKYDVL